MRKLLAASLAAGLAGGLSACATVAPADKPSANIDFAKVDAVERAAWARGAKVHWRVFPQKGDRGT